MRRGGMVATGQSNLPSIGCRNTSLDFFEFGEQAKDFLDKKANKSVSDKYRIIWMALRWLLKEWIRANALWADRGSSAVWIYTHNTARKMMKEVQDTARKQINQSEMRTGSENASARRKIGHRIDIRAWFRKFMPLGRVAFYWALEDSDWSQTRSRNEVTDLAALRIKPSKTPLKHSASAGVAADWATNWRRSCRTVCKSAIIVM